MRRVMHHIEAQEEEIRERTYILAINRTNLERILNALRDMVPGYGITKEERAVMSQIASDAVWRIHKELWKEDENDRLRRFMAAFRTDDSETVGGEDGKLSR